VRLTVAGPGGSGALQLADLVHVTEPPLPPDANFTASPLTGVAPLTVSFQDLTSGTVTGWEWRFGDGTSSRLQNPSHVYRIPGTYSVRMRATGPAGSDVVSRLNSIHVLAPKSGDAQQSPSSPATGGTVKGQ
jgi:PKD repeat protein